MSYDAFAADKDSFYCYSEVRGLARAIKGPQGQWKKVVACNRELLGLQSVSLVLHKGMLLMRHAGVKDAPFIRIDKESLKLSKDGPVFKFDSDKESKLKNLDWSEQRVPRTIIEEEEKDHSEEQKTELDNKQPTRKMGSTPLCSDGEHIYALSIH